ncbi:P-loop containing nucleoside triphosphate hydrolase protein [Mycena filopes]|nr:P-loop containing nucleoside triphosphate hydrolase protein [Mycena filopes]
MPFTPVTTLDPERLQSTAQTLCDVFGIPSLHPHQEKAGQNILKGISTLLDIPTGGGKTLAFWYALFYHWQPGNEDPNSQKIVLVIGPLVALLQSQARSLNEKGITAVALTGDSENLEEMLIVRLHGIVFDLLHKLTPTHQGLGQNQFRVGLVGPEMALSTQFHKHVLNQIPFTKNVICLVIDEAHCICEWGTDDFRPEYAELVKLAARLPSGLPILGATATAPKDVIKTILDNLGLAADCARVQVSNEKLNMSLSVRILQHEPESFADLLLLFDGDEFAQTLAYTNGRQEAEKMQDFLRDNAPDSFDVEKAFEFYHRNIDEQQKIAIQARIESGELRGVPTTDALGLGMDFRNILRVLLWMLPRTFLSLVQKLGRCVRNRDQRGEGVVFITKAMYTRCCAELEALRAERDEAREGSPVSEEEVNDEEPQDRDAALNDDSEEEEEEETPAAPAKRRRGRKKGKRKAMSAMELRDKRYLLEYITTTKCRRVPWNKFFGNKDKERLNFPVPAGPCCDNCNPEAFEVETILLDAGPQLKAGRKATSAPELENAVKKRLEVLRERIVGVAFPKQHFLTGNALISDPIVDVLARRARLITSVDTLLQHTRWIHAPTYGAQVVKAIQEVVLLFPDHAQIARDTEAAEKSQRMLSAAAFKELRTRLIQVFDGCYAAVYSEMETLPEEPAPTRKRKHPRQPRRICQIFLQLPRITAFPDYYELIKQPISMKIIKSLSQKPTHFTGLLEYRAAWHLLFANARQYNIEGSQVYEDADYLQEVFDRNLHSLSYVHSIPGREQLQAAIAPAAASPTPPPYLLPQVE